MYSRNLEIGPGKVAYGDNILLYRPQIIDQENELTNLCQVYDPYSLQVCTGYIKFRDYF